MALGAQQPMQSAMPSPMKFFEAVNSYQCTAALKAAIELDVFSAIGEGASTPAMIAQKTNAAERGVRILCDFLVIHGFLTKADGQYALTPDSAMFLTRKSQAYMGSAIQFLLNPKLTEGFARLTEAVRSGGTVIKQDVNPDDPMWVDFAQSMMTMMFPMAQNAAGILPLADDRDTKVLDIAASHGIYGISVAKRHPRAHIVALDGKNVLELTKENAQRFGIADRFSTIPGDAFTVDLGSEYDAILLPNLLHHFNPPTCEKLLAKCHRALRPGGLLAIIEFVPNDDRVTPPVSAGFALIMLATTPNGDAYTLRQYQQMLSATGFGIADAYPLPPSEHLMILSKRG
ncbi:MAG: methyltransferase [Terriglobales bacterium]